MSDFNVRTVVEAAKTVVVLTGQCDLRSRDEMTSVLLQAVASAPLVIVDLAAVQFLDSSGLHALVAAHQVARQKASTLHVVNAGGSVAAVLELTGVIELLRPPEEGAGSITSRPSEAATRRRGPHGTPRNAEVITYSDATHLRTVRAFVDAHARRWGLASEPTSSLILAVSELVTNTLQHTTEGGKVVIWRDGGRIICDVIDTGPMRTFDREMPAADADSGRGLPIVRQVCDDVTAIAGPDHTIVRLCFAIDRPSMPE